MSPLALPVARRLLAAVALAERPGSDGECLAAEAAIGRLIVAHAEEFRRLLGAPAIDMAGEDWRDLVAKCLRRSDEISAWEQRFLRSLLDFRTISDKQHACLGEIATRLATAEAA